MGTMNLAVAVANEISLQPFFVLHKASKPARESSGKSRRMRKVSQKSNDSNAEAADGVDLGSQSFHFLWSRIESIIEVGDISILASWYFEQGNHENPIVVIIDGIERCCGFVLSDFIVMLSEWVSKIPILLILGVTTTTDALRDKIPSSVLHYLVPSKFVLGSPTERMDGVIGAVLVKHCACFSLSHKVATFLRNYFLMHDGTLISFIEALKMASFQHFVLQPPSFSGLMERKFSQDLSNTNTALIQERAIKKAFGLQSQERNNQVEQNGDISGHGLSEMQRECNKWGSLVMCLYEAGKHRKVTLLDLYCAVLDPQMYKSRTSGEKYELEHNNGKSSTRYLLGQHPSVQKCSCIRTLNFRSSYIQNNLLEATTRPKFWSCRHYTAQIQYLQAVELNLLLAIWAKLTEGLGEIHDKVEELKSLMLNKMPLSMEPTDISKKHAIQSNISVEKDTTIFNKKASELASCMTREHMQPIECIPLHEIVRFKNLDELQAALMGDRRTRVQQDLLESQKILKCTCCKRNGSMLPSMHDTSLMYGLAKEHGDLINLRDLFQSFKATISNSSMRTKNKLKQTQSPKKRKTFSEPQSISDASIQ